MNTLILKKAAIAAAAAAALLLAGCSSVELDESAKEGTTLGDAAGEAGAGPAGHGQAGVGRGSVYFAFDSYAIEPRYIPVIEREAKALNANPQQAAVIEGNTDSRGSREYNLALGQKRSEAVKQRLQLLGVQPARLEAVSFGREKPVAFGDNEEDWAKNRRADIVPR